MTLLNTPNYEKSGEGFRFEVLLFELSARFISLPPEGVDDEIKGALKKICECLYIDRSTLWQQQGTDPVSLHLTHVYQRADAPPTPAQADGSQMFPWAVEQLRRGETIVMSNLDELPPEAATDAASWQRYGTRSSLVIPLSIGGTGFGALAFASIGESREWEPRIIQRLKLFAQVIANAIARARHEQALRESRERFALAVEGVNDGVWDWDMVTGNVYYSSRWKSMLGYAEDEIEGTLSAWEGLIHPNDLEHARTALGRHLGGEMESYELEHRLRCRDGSYRWILTRGKALRNKAGQPYRMAGSHTDITARKDAEAQARNAYAEVQQLRDQLHQENTYLRSEMAGRYGQGRLVGRSHSLQRVLAQAEQVAVTDSTVLLMGETGTGKELIASAIHDLSSRCGKGMVRVNCAAIPASLLESELFGREKGAYTGALSKQIGRFEMASGSTLFLDEIGELPPDVQVKLLRVLQERQIERLGSPRPVRIDVRIIAATNRDLETAVREGRFRQDLYYRLNVFPIVVPPLRERRDDIPILVSAFVEEFSTRFGKKVEAIVKESMEALQRYHWPGNVRELRNVIERAMIVARGPRLWIEPPQSGVSGSSAPLALRDTETQHIRSVLDMTGWRIRGKNGAAAILGLKPTTLESRMAKLGIHRQQKSTK